MRVMVPCGDGLAAACDGIDAVVHPASDAPNAAIADVQGTRRLLDAARAAGIRHFVYMSIAGTWREWLATHSPQPIARGRRV